MFQLLIKSALNYLPTIWQFIKSNKSRFLIEVAVTIFSAALGYGIKYFSNDATLKACQDERTVLLRETAAKSAALEAVKYAGVIATLQTQLTQANDTILLQKQKAASDSISRMSELESMRAIINYLRQYPSGPGFRTPR
ncbi:hypothetical protein [Siphonobacter curvatus]|uniref:Uncharacterized protein n=1 Tax=Siphonobacter curvatus TaxID=2094562 RepID=A0A2S7INL0_9BACT|nr:hypothetical protein [Siphonobacter curvatus]PQA59150.1 hypothetical protein C5O19_05705 [Siphonobacter curvatus]